MAKNQGSQELRIGSSGFSYPGPPPKGWYRVFYPEARRKNFDELEYYSSLFNTVEINTSFYRPPSPAVVDAWVKKTPDDFEFSVKVWQKFTHPMRLGGEATTEQKWEEPTREDATLFKESLKPLADGGKLGILLFQYPPSFHYTEKNAEKLRRTFDFFDGYPKVIELRHQTWSERKSETKTLLESRGAGWVVIDEPKFASSVRQEFEAVANIFYLRLHGRNEEKWWRHEEAWERYDYFYGAQEIRLIGDKIKKNLRDSPGTKSYIFFNNHARAQAPANALMLKHELEGGAAAGVPRSLIEAYPELSGIVQPAARNSLF